MSRAAVFCSTVDAQDGTSLVSWEGSFSLAAAFRSRSPDTLRHQSRPPATGALPQRSSNPFTEVSSHSSRAVTTRARETSGTGRAKHSTIQRSSLRHLCPGKGCVEPGMSCQARAVSCPRTERVEPQTLPARSSDTQAIHAATALGKPQAVIDEEHKATLGCTKNCWGRTG